MTRVKVQYDAAPKPGLDRGWFYYFPLNPKVNGGGGNFPTWQEAVDAAYGHWNDAFERCPMCDSRDLVTKRDR